MNTAFSPPQPIDASAATMMTERKIWPAIKAGFAQKCPHCGQGRLFAGYLKVVPACSQCGEVLHHHRADDAPPYITIFVVGHIIGTLMLLTEEINDALPLWIHAVVWPLLTIALTLFLLPRFKGALIAYQWALRMHGFDPAHRADD